MRDPKQARLFYEVLGAEIKELREKRGLKQFELAELVGLPGSMICQIEKGKKRLFADTLNKILLVLEGHEDLPV